MFKAALSPVQPPQGFPDSPGVQRNPHLCLSSCSLLSCQHAIYQLAHCRWSAWALSPGPVQPCCWGTEYSSIPRGRVVNAPPLSRVNQVTSLKRNLLPPRHWTNYLWLNFHNSVLCKRHLPASSRLQQRLRDHPRSRGGWDHLLAPSTHPLLYRPVPFQLTKQLRCPEAAKGSKWPALAGALQRDIHLPLPQETHTASHRRAVAYSGRGT